MNITLESLEAKLLEENLKVMFQQAYEQGLHDAKSIQSLPPMLKKKDLAEYFQVSLPSVENIIRMEGFPKSKVAKARYPRDQVIEWVNKNVERVNQLQKAI
ncbi:hypothetical protein SAMN05216389_12620 [Oceanobacillus limi]|uniref:Helix-turn-helix domain-containing protein n=1 Tax=Oceanobacillus limi TaxID=930131 RepID=A0A1I0GZ53_9BACI|nr:helix-turn-helix domain-containing protein [Oceanobacillus limi]SET76700.1 hypothetical protein SAMN05216389_12620 [Oceanobacillus limi]